MRRLRPILLFLAVALTALLALAPTRAVAQEAEPKFGLTALIETKGWTWQPIVTHKDGQVIDLFGVKWLDFDIVSIVGYDTDLQAGNVGGSIMHTFPIAKNVKVDLGIRVVFQQNRKPDLAIIAGFKVWEF